MLYSLAKMSTPGGALRFDVEAKNKLCSCTESAESSIDRDADGGAVVLRASMLFTELQFQQAGRAADCSRAVASHTILHNTRVGPKKTVIAANVGETLYQVGCCGVVITKTAWNPMAQNLQAQSDDESEKKNTLACTHMKQDLNTKTSTSQKQN